MRTKRNKSHDDVLSLWKLMAGVLVACVGLVLTFWVCIVSLAYNVVQTVQEDGLKPTIERVWEGPNG